MPRLLAGRRALARLTAPLHIPCRLPAPQVLASLQDEATLADTMRSVGGIAADPAALKQARLAERVAASARAPARGQGRLHALQSVHARTSPPYPPPHQVASNLSGEIQGTVKTIRGDQ